MACVVGGGFLSEPKPSSTCSGASTSAVGRRVRTSAPLPSPTSASPAPPVPPRLAMRRSISTNRPDSGRFDQSELAVTWKKMSWPSPRLAAGDERRAVLQARPHLHLGSEPRRVGQHLPVDQHFRPARRQAGKQAVVARRAPSGCGVDQDSAPPSVRPPSRSGTGSRSSPPFSSRGPAKRTSTPPFFTHCSTRSLMLARQRADVGQHHHGGVALDEALDAGRRGWSRRSWRSPRTAAARVSM